MKTIFLFLLLLTKISVAQTTLTFKLKNFDNLQNHLPVIKNAGDVINVLSNDSLAVYQCLTSEPKNGFIVLDENSNPRWIIRTWISEDDGLEKEIIIDYNQRSIENRKYSYWDSITNEIQAFDNQLMSNSGINNNTELIYQKLDSVYLDVAKNNSSSFIGLYYFWLAEPRMSYSEKQGIFQSFDNILSEHKLYQNLISKINHFNEPSYGDLYTPKIVLNDKNSPIELLIDSGVVTILHVYNSGCRYCKQSQKELNDSITQIKPSLLNIYSLSIDDNQNLWRSTDLYHNIPWEKFWLENGVYHPLALNYALTATPSFIIFDKNKKFHSLITGTDIGSVVEQVQSLIDGSN